MGPQSTIYKEDTADWTGVYQNTAAMLVTVGVCEDDHLTPAEGLPYAAGMLPSLTNRKPQIWVTMLWSERTVLTSSNSCLHSLLFYAFGRLPACIYMYPVYRAWGGHTGHWTEDGDAVSYHMGAKNQSQVLCKSSKAPNPWAISPDPYSFNFLRWFCKNLFMGGISLWEINYHKIKILWNVYYQ